MLKLLVAPKDPADKMEQARVIYAVKCGGCDSGKVCETGCPLKKKIMEHQRDSSPVSQHAKDSGHPVNYDHVKVLDRESGWFRRGIKESIHILKSPSDLNRDRGRYSLRECTTHSSTLKQRVRPALPLQSDVILHLINN